MDRITQTNRFWLAADQPVSEAVLNQYGGRRILRQ